VDRRAPSLSGDNCGGDSDPNRVEDYLESGMKEIQLSRGFVTQVDDEDFEFLSQISWFAFKHGQKFTAARTLFINGRRKTIFMHRCILLPCNTSSKIEIDHIDGNALNNQKANLRTCTHSQNTKNKDKQSINTSGFKGVYFHKKNKKWRAQIGLNGRRVTLGEFHTKEEAASTYDLSAVKYYGEFARLNFPGGDK
jgi:hypothetical protein